MICSVEKTPNDNWCAFLKIKHTFLYICWFKLKSFPSINRYFQKQNTPNFRSSGTLSGSLTHHPRLLVFSTVYSICLKLRCCHYADSHVHVTWTVYNSSWKLCAVFNPLAVLIYSLGSRKPGRRCEAAILSLRPSVISEWRCSFELRRVCVQSVRFSAAQQRLAEQSRDTHTSTGFFPRCAYTVWLPARLSSDGRSSHRQLTAVTQRHVQHERGCEHSSARTCSLF